MKRQVCKLLVFATMLASFDLGAQELSPRAYWPAPVGTRVVTLGYSYTSGDAIPDRSLPITGVDSSINSLHFGYRHTLNLWDRTANITFEVPYIDGTTVGSRDGGLIREREYRGVGDLTATLSVNLLGAPAMNRQEFDEMRRNRRPILGASLKLVAPIGNYDSSRLINVGSNRWAMKAELGYIFLPKFWGKGYGSQISRTIVNYAKTVPEIKILVAIIDPQNTASKRILL